jgi:AcrR family transcriptional regulator
MTKRDLILHCAAQLFASKGYRETSIAELAQVSGVAEGTIFYHFKTKDGVLLAIIEDLKDEITGKFDAYLRETTFASGLEMVEGLVSFYLYLAGRREDFFQLLHRHTLYELAATNEACRAHLETLYSSVVELFEKALRRGQADGSIDARASRKTALILLTLVDGLVRFKHHNLYDAGALYNELIAACRRILQPIAHPGSDAC